MVQEKRSHVEPENEAANSPPPSTARSVARGTLKAITKVTALDVISRDVRRMKPRHPQLWKDLFNAQSKLKQQYEDERSGNSDGATNNKAAKNALITALVGLGVSIYGLILIGHQTSPYDLPWINKIGMITLVTAGLLQAAIYGWITLKLMHRAALSQQHNSERPGRKKS